MAIDGPDRFADLVTQVQHRAAATDPAELLDAAAAISAEHAADADRLLDHFVAHARDAGMSWTDIGARLGVTKQAARQRFTAAPPTVMPFAARTAPRLQACLDQAAEHARTDGADAIGTHHLLAGLLTEGVAAAILERLGVHADQIQAASHRLFGLPAETPRDDVPPMSTEATCALDTAAHNAATNTGGTTPPEVRTEHLLGTLALDPGSRARRVLNELRVDTAALKRELQCYITLNPVRPARWWKRRPTAGHSCSFCGRTSDPDQLVNGPGITICRPCVTLAAEILTTRQTSDQTS
jgi:ATP-dependent Clp protease ATP-binding subunit ClpA